MIKFFRTIRQNLLLENKTGKYFKYAIGEIVLVVVGILIALQINTWNEANKEKELEYDILRQLRKNLAEDIGNITSIIEAQNSTLSSQNNLIDWMESENRYNDSIAGHLINSFIYHPFATRKGQYEALKQIGMRKISNDALRNQISNLYESTNPDYLGIEVLYYKQVQNLVDKSVDHFNELTWTSRIELNDITKFKSDNRYLFQLKYLKNLGKEQQLRLINNKKEFELTHKMIALELEQL
ncbi:MAG: hypothetical protein BM564_02910 [Bacteroidetes bacterium MedPE-SWsnd-G2]|nr:MAG: hypothetical protein BM564_02910 [Bacteroidetes bacterium MedPE-SWsnd-G2]